LLVDNLYVTPIAFFLLGLPAGLAANHLILRLTNSYRDIDEDEEGDASALAVRRLPWQRGDWPLRVRLLSAGLVPFLMALAGSRFDVLQAAGVSLLLIGLVICTATDLLRYRVPNAVTYPGIVLAILAAGVMPGADLTSALISALVGGAFFLVMAIITRGGLGLGDVKLAVLIGAALGFPASYQALAFGILAGGLVMGLLLLCGVVSRKQAVPYAPFLALAAIAVVLIEGAAFAPLAS
jgi:prepilin signal peptidase PulO-like enzyme (type II secretory pathway)